MEGLLTLNALCALLAVLEPTKLLLALVTQTPSALLALPHAALATLNRFLAQSRATVSAEPARNAHASNSWFPNAVEFLTLSAKPAHDVARAPSVCLRALRPPTPSVKLALNAHLATVSLLRALRLETQSAHHLMVATIKKRRKNAQLLNLTFGKKQNKLAKTQ